MAQLSSVQREPSMEEILASIRRIIEDSDIPTPAEVASAARPTVEAAFASPYAAAESTPAVASARAPELDIEPTIVPAAANEDRPGAAVEFADKPVAAAASAEIGFVESAPVAPEQKPSSPEAFDWDLGVSDDAVIKQLSEADFDLTEVADAVLKELSEEQAFAEVRTVEIETAADKFEEPAVALEAPTGAFEEPEAARVDAVKVLNDWPQPASPFDAVEFVNELPQPAAEMQPETHVSPVAETRHAEVDEYIAVAEPAAEMQPETHVSPVTETRYAEIDEYIAAAKPVAAAIEATPSEVEAPLANVEEPAVAIETIATGLTLANNNDPARAAILSEQAGRQVTASFNELAEAFAARGRKSLDEVAEDLMRPMLQDWLDNNLPTLVERLVREEIERVARGAEA